MTEAFKVTQKQPIELNTLIGHNIAVSGNSTLAKVQKAFQEHAYKYMAVEQDGRVTGLCSREKVGDLLGSQFGFSIYSQKLISDYTLPHCEVIAEDSPIERVLEKVFSRPQEQFFHDVVLVDQEFGLIGLIPVEQLVRLQNHLLSQKITALASSECNLLKQKQNLSELAGKLELTNAELKAARDTAIEGTKLKSQFLANMSHEIRTPMNGIIGMISLLMDSELTEDQHHYCETICNSADALLSLINDILDFSKIEAGRLDISQEETPVRTLAEECLHLLAESATSKQIELLLDIDPAVPDWIHMDPLRYRQILNNLLGNAIKFTHSGEVIVRIRIHGTAESSCFLHTEVQDTGIGISKEHQTKLFEPFVQGDGSTNRKYGGTGLGLAICSRLASLLNGNLFCESEPGVGSTFGFHIPLSIATAPETVVTIEKLPPHMRVLIVDDHATRREILGRQICALGGQALQADSAASAYMQIREAYAQDSSFDCVLIDTGLPEESGLRLCETINNDEALQNLPVIMISPIGCQQAPSSRRIQCSGWLFKPIGPSSLSDVLQRVQTRQTPRKKKVQTPDETLPAQKSMRILIADDSTTNQEIAFRFLERLGHSVYIAENGLQVLDIIRNEPIDCILMDCQMPQMDGYAATRAIRQGLHGISQVDIPIAAMTAHAMQEDVQKCLHAGMNDFIAKPITLEQLAGVLHAIAFQRAPLAQNS